MSKSVPLIEPVAIAAVNQYFDDLIALVDPGAVLPHLRAELEDYRARTQSPLPDGTTQLLITWFSIGADGCRHTDL